MLPQDEVDDNFESKQQKEKTAKAPPHRNLFMKPRSKKGRETPLPEPKKEKR